MAETALEITEIVQTLEMTGGATDVTLEIHEPAEIEILEIAEQGADGTDGHTPTTDELTAIIEPLIQVASDASYVHTQVGASTLWTVTHNLNKYPSVTIVDSGDNVVRGDIQYLNANSLTISFAAMFGGKVYCN